MSIKKYSIIPQDALMAQHHSSPFFFTIKVLSNAPDLSIRDDTPGSNHLHILINRTLLNPFYATQDPASTRSDEAQPWLWAANKAFLEGWMRFFALDCAATVVCRGSWRSFMDWKIVNNLHGSLADFVKDEEGRQVAEKLLERMKIQDGKVEIWTPSPFPGQIGRITVEFWPPVQDEEKEEIMYECKDAPFRSSWTKGEIQSEAKDKEKGA